jgi:hypothetical protein
MGGEALAAPPRDVYRPAVKAAAACPFEPLARVLARLLGRPVAAAAVRDRAVGLGLLRWPAAGAPGRIRAEAASRLLLAGYHLPALLEAACPRRACEHLAAGRLVFVLLGEGEPAAVQLHALLPPDNPAWALVDAAAGARVIEEVSAPWLFEGEAGGRLMVAAARRWDDLPAAGRFFGGSRDRDGSYHWDAADCDTDAAGRVLRCW